MAAVFYCLLLAGAPETVSAGGWVNKGDRTDSVYQGTPGDNAVDTDSLLDKLEQNIGILEKYFSDWLADMAYTLIYNQSEEKNGVDFSIDAVVLGRLGENMDVSYMQFELAEGNPWGLIGAAVYYMVAGGCISVAVVYLLYLFAQHFWKSGQRERSELKENLTEFVLKFLLVFCAYKIVDYGYYFRDVATHSLLKGVSSMFHVNVSDNASIVDTFLSGYIDGGKGVVNALFLIASVCAGYFFMFNYIGTALIQTIAFGALPFAIFGSIKNKKLLSTWTATFISNLSIPMIDAVILIMPNLVGVIAENNAAGLGDSFGIAVIKLAIIWGVIPARNALIRMLCGNVQPANGLRGLAGMALMAARVLGTKKSSGAISSKEGITGSYAELKERQGIEEASDIRFNQVNSNVRARMDDDIRNILDAEDVETGIHDTDDEIEKILNRSGERPESYDSADGLQAGDISEAEEPILAETDETGSLAAEEDGTNNNIQKEALEEKNNFGAVDTDRDELVIQEPDSNLMDTYILGNDGIVQPVGYPKGIAASERKVKETGENGNRKGTTGGGSDHKKDGASAGKDVSGNTFFAEDDRTDRKGLYVGRYQELDTEGETPEDVGKKTTKVSNDVGHGISSSDKGVQKRGTDAENSDERERGTKEYSFSSDSENSNGSTDDDRLDEKTASNLNRLSGADKDRYKNLAIKEQMQEKIEANREVIDALHNSIADSGKKVAAYKADTEKQKGVIADARQQVKTAEAAHTDALSVYNAFKKEYGSSPAHAQQLETFKTSVSTAKEHLDSVQSRTSKTIKNAQNNIIKNNENIAKLNEYSSNVNSEIRQLESSNQKLQTGIDNAVQREKQYAANYKSAGMDGQVYTSAEVFRADAVYREKVASLANLKNFDNDNFSRNLTPEQRMKFYSERAIQQVERRTDGYINTAVGAGVAVAAATATVFGGPEMMGGAAMIGYGAGSSLRPWTENIRNSRQEFKQITKSEKANKTNAAPDKKTKNVNRNNSDRKTRVSAAEQAEKATENDMQKGSDMNRILKEHQRNIEKAGENYKNRNDK